MNLLLPSTLESIASRVDGSVKIVFASQEIDSESAARVFSLRGKFVKLLISDSNVEQAEKLVAKLPLKDEKKPKTPSQRLRFAFLKYHKALNSKQEFESFYSEQMSKLIILIENKSYELKEK